MRRPIFTIKKWQGSFPYMFECRHPYYQVVFTDIEEGKRAIESRFGSCIFRLSKELRL